MHGLWRKFLPTGASNECLDHSGFFLLEVLIAITLLAIFLSAYMVGQGQNIHDSIQLKEDLVLSRLAEDVINNLTLNPPQLSPALTLAPERKKFTGHYEDYEYSVEYKKLEIPDFRQLNQTAGAEGLAVSSGIQGRVFAQVKKNVENLLWQVSVTVNNLKTGDTYTIATWLRKPKTPVRVSL